MNIKALIWDNKKQQKIIIDYAKRYNIDLVFNRDNTKINETIAEEKPDIAIINFSLLSKNSSERIQEIGKEDALLIILLTAEEEAAARKLISKYSFDEYLIKPFTPRELVAKINKVLGRGKGMYNATLWPEFPEGGLIYYY